MVKVQKNDYNDSYSEKLHTFGVETNISTIQTIT